MNSEKGLGLGTYSIPISCIFCGVDTEFIECGPQVYCSFLLNTCAIRGIGLLVRHDNKFQYTNYIYYTLLTTDADIKYLPKTLHTYNDYCRYFWIVFFRLTKLLSYIIELFKLTSSLLMTYNNVHRCVTKTQFRYYVYSLS